MPTAAAASANSAALGTMHREVERQPDRERERIDHDRHQHRDTDQREHHRQRRGCRVTSATNPTVIAAVNTMNVRMVLIVTAPSSKPSSRRQRMPHVRHRSYLPNQRRMNVRRAPHHGQCNTSARRSIRPNDGSFEGIGATLETFDSFISQTSGVRRTLAGLIFGIAYVCASIAISGWLLQRSAFDPDRTGDLAEVVLQDNRIKTQIINTIADAAATQRGLDKATVRQTVAAVASTPQGAEFLGKVHPRRARPADRSAEGTGAHHRRADGAAGPQRGRRRHPVHHAAGAACVRARHASAASFGGRSPSAHSSLSGSS